MKILLVDDDAFLIDMYAAKFTSSNHEVDSAKTVEAALEKLRAGAKYDAILLDMVLPGMTGLDLLKAIQQENIAGDAKVIVLSNQGDQSDIDAAMAVGAHGYIVKAHMIPSEVVAKVAGIVGGYDK
jgi:CheY-like chemotaxis protein